MTVGKGTLSGIQGYVTAFGSGTLSLVANDSLDTAVRNATITGSDLLGFGNAGDVNYSGAAVASITVDGGKAADTYNIPATNAGVPVAINGGTANDTFNVGTGGATSVLDDIQGPLSINGGGGTDTLNLNDQGQTAGFNYTLNKAAIARSGIATIGFSAVEHVKLTAGSGSDSLTASSLPAGVTTIDLGAGANTLFGPAASTVYTINGANQGTVGKTLDFLNTQFLVGGPGSDTFAFSGAAPSIAGGITGGAGTNKLDYSHDTNPAIVNLQTQSATGIAGGAIGGFSGIASVVGRSGGGDTLVGTDAATAWSITGSDAGKAGKFTFSGIDNLHGGAGNDTFKLANNAGVKGSIDGGGGTNVLDYSAWTSGVSVNLGGGASTGAPGGAANIQVLNGGAGNDTLVGSSGNDIIRGNGGDDLIYGGGGDDVLIGGAGNDLISTSGSGRSVLIGSLGDDTLIGGSAGDVLIGGSTNYDAYSATNDAALLAILREWQSADSYATRISKIDTGLAGGAKLSATTVHDDQNVDVLSGATNYPTDPDWFWAGVGTNPDVTDAETGEQIN